MTFLYDIHSLAELRRLAETSHRVICTHQHPAGALPAAPTFSAYRGYAWLRDGGFTAEGISRYGDRAAAGRFHSWVAGVLTRRRDQVDSLVKRRRRGETVPVEDMLPTRFTFDGANGIDPWWDFQTDGYGTWLWSVVTHADRHGEDLARWRAGLEVAVDYLTGFWDLPCYDWWEEHVERRHVSTLAAISGGLREVATSGLLDSSRREAALTASEAAREVILREGSYGGHLVKWLGSRAVDGSLPSCVVPFGIVPVGSDVATATLAAVAADLEVDGGVHRFSGDDFYGGGLWPLLSALLGWNLARVGHTERAWRHLEWIARQATPEGHLPEQVDDHLLHPEHQADWVVRWGPVATPLLWSHGMFLILADELGVLMGSGS